ncbi:MAG: PAS domain S-box protein [Candidatus Schekmanbacteria bacterium]|nr:PAS domain S-box protein [Candidatus Schekmanbacteria bacterium]
MSESETRDAEREFLRARISELEEQLGAARAAADDCRCFLDAIPDAVLIVTPDGRIEDANDQAHRLFGYSRDEIVHLGIEQLLPARYREMHAAQRSDYEKSPHRRMMGKHRLDLVALHKDGTEIHVDIGLSPVVTGAGQRVITAIRDISQQRRMQRELHQAKRMEAVGRVAAGVAHDFNNLLMPVIGYAELVYETLAPDSALRADVLEIVRAAKRARALTKQLLATGRHQSLDLGPVNLNEIISESRRMFQGILGDSVELTIALDYALGCVIADASQIDQVFLNLVVNARDAMPCGGRLAIATRRLAVPDAHGHDHFGLACGTYAHVEVTDTGVGMDPETAEHIFEPFFSTKRVGEGHGLGLATAYGVITQCGGAIRVFSTPGAGTAFHVFLPAADAALLAADARSAPGRQDGRGAIALVVDGDLAVVEMARRVLTRRGYRVLDASSVVEGRRILAEHDAVVEILIADLLMPDADGVAVRAELLRTNPELKTLFLSAHPSTELGSSTQRAGDAFLVKPFTLMQLEAALSGVVGEAEP